jgi:two-component system cell cycle response regulator CtrA
VRRSKGHSRSLIRTRQADKLDAKALDVGGIRVHRTGKEYAMLERVSLGKGPPLTKELFLNHLYGGMDAFEFGSFDVFIRDCARSRPRLAAAPIASEIVGVSSTRLRA